MTKQTTSQVEAAEREKFEAWFAKTHWPNEDAEEQARAFNDPSWGRLIRDSWVVWLGRATLASQQEVAAPVLPSANEWMGGRYAGDEWKQWCAGWEAARVASRVPVASPAAPRKIWPFVESPGEFTERLRMAIPQFGGDLLAAVRNVLIENPAQIKQGADGPLSELTRERLSGVEGSILPHEWRDSPAYGGEICANCGVVKGTSRAAKSCATPPVGAGGAGVMDARPDSVHSDSGECDRVQGPGPTDAERYQWLRADLSGLDAKETFPGLYAGCPDGLDITQENFDAAINAAILAKGGDQGEGK